MAHFIDAEVDGLAGSNKVIKIAFDRHMSIVYGLNGSGKTSLLTILYSAIRDDESLLRSVVFKAATVRFFAVARDCIVTRTITSGPDATWKTLPVLEPPLGKKFVCQFLRASRLYASGKSVPSTKRLDEQWLDQQFAEHVVNRWKTYNTGVSIKVQEAQARGLANILSAVMAEQPTTAEAIGVELDHAYDITNRFLNRQGSVGILGSPEEFKGRYQRNKILQSVVNDVAAVERDIELATKPQKEMERLISRLYSGGKKVVFKENSIEVEVSQGSIGLELLSSGEKHLIRLFVETLNASTSTILIDEPELSIHVDWQRELVSAFRTLNPDAQFILATHSPEIMAEVEDERIFSL